MVTADRGSFRVALCVRPGAPYDSIMRLVDIRIYPVKSGAGCPVTEATVEPWGLAGDRRWAVVDEAGPARLVWLDDPRRRTIDPAHGGLPGEVVSFAWDAPLLLASAASLRLLDEQIGGDTPSTWRASDPGQGQGADPHPGETPPLGRQDLVRHPPGAAAPGTTPARRSGHRQIGQPGLGRTPRSIVEVREGHQAEPVFQRRL
ncbi:MOSC N-terminal beta barrel domain-containing protein [Nonomuraea polychroma]|uniref:MOSC N-terminal beta barrel domain-containing protein n=1 Tax=Nonomuraea polychroma TaxID=46176 RepID=UPI003D939BF9